MTSISTDTVLDERRSAPRYEMEIPLCLISETGQYLATTRDVSARGVFFIAHLSAESGVPEAEVGSEVEFTITFPPEVTLSESLFVRCRGRVVRAFHSDQGLGVATEIQHYEFLPLA